MESALARLLPPPPSVRMVIPRTREAPSAVLQAAACPTQLPRLSALGARPGYMAAFNCATEANTNACGRQDPLTPRKDAEHGLHAVGFTAANSGRPFPHYPSMSMCHKCAQPPARPRTRAPAHAVPPPSASPPLSHRPTDPPTTLSQRHPRSPLYSLFASSVSRRPAYSAFVNVGTLSPRTPLWTMLSPPTLCLRRRGSAMRGW